ncbi:DNA polymerase IV [archaeon HR01]|nr:DNA polymerase IV [archaeon HR01]
MGASNRVVLFLDLDHFFAQVEEIQQPALKGRPVVVCVYSGRTETSGVVSSANYEARSYGVRAGMPIARALRLLPPTAVFLPARLQLYSSYSEGVMAILSQYSDKLSVESVDEAAVDITDRVGGDFSKAEELARELKERIRSEMGLRCSVGVAPNRIVAKVAADSSKPDGLKVVRPEEVRSFLAGLDVEALPGVGRKLGRMLKGLGVETVGKLAEMEPTPLIPIVGRRRAIQLIMAARGNLTSPSSLGGRESR